jgi:hypothetical protein
MNRGEIQDRLFILKSRLTGAEEKIKIELLKCDNDKNQKSTVVGSVLK